MSPSSSSLICLVFNDVSLVHVPNLSHVFLSLNNFNVSLPLLSPVPFSLSPVSCALIPYCLCVFLTRLCPVSLSLYFLLCPHSYNLSSSSCSCALIPLLIPNLSPVFLSLNSVNVSLPLLSHVPFYPSPVSYALIPYCLCVFLTHLCPVSLSLICIRFPYP
jgi:hypothetical protein